VFRRELVPRSAVVLFVPVLNLGGYGIDSVRTGLTCTPPRFLAILLRIVLTAFPMTIGIEPRRLPESRQD
jgi:hypothetical protein